MFLLAFHCLLFNFLKIDKKILSAWILSQRLPLFWKTDLFLDYLLCKLLIAPTEREVATEGMLALSLRLTEIQFELVSVESCNSDTLSLSHLSSPCSSLHNINSLSPTCCLLPSVIPHVFSRDFCITLIISLLALCYPFAILVTSFLPLYYPLVLFCDLFGTSCYFLVTRIVPFIHS